MLHVDFKTAPFQSLVHAHPQPIKLSSSSLSTIECWSQAGFCDQLGYLTFTPSLSTPPFTLESQAKLEELFEKSVWVGRTKCTIRTYLDEVLAHFKSLQPKLYLRGSYASYVLNPQENLRILIDDFILQNPKLRELMERGWENLKFAPVTVPQDSDWALLIDGIPTYDLLEEFRGYVVKAHHKIAHISELEAATSTFKTLLIPHPTQWSTLQDPIVISSVSGDGIKLDLVSGMLVEAPYLFSLDNRYIHCGAKPQPTVIEGNFWQSTLDVSLQMVRFENRHLKDFYALLKAVQHLASGKTWDESAITAAEIAQNFITNPPEKIALFLRKRWEGTPLFKRCLFILLCLIKNKKIREQIWCLSLENQGSFEEEALQTLEQIKAFPEAHGPLPEIPLHPFAEPPSRCLLFLKQSLFLPLNPREEKPEGIYASWRMNCERLNSAKPLPDEFLEEIADLFLNGFFSAEEEMILAKKLKGPSLLGALIFRCKNRDLLKRWSTEEIDISLEKCKRMDREAGSAFVIEWLQKSPSKKLFLAAWEHNFLQCDATTQKLFIKITEGLSEQETLLFLQELGPKVDRLHKGFVIRLWIALFKLERIPLISLNEKVQGWLQSHIPFETKAALSLKVLNDFGTTHLSDITLMQMAEFVKNTSKKDHENWFIECLSHSPVTAEIYYRCHMEKLSPLSQFFPRLVKEKRAATFLTHFSGEVSEELFLKNLPKIDPKERLSCILARPSCNWKSYTQSAVLTADEHHHLWHAILNLEPSIYRLWEMERQGIKPDPHQAEVIRHQFDAVKSISRPEDVQEAFHLLSSLQLDAFEAVFVKLSHELKALLTARIKREISFTVDQLNIILKHPFVASTIDLHLPTMQEESLLKLILDVEKPSILLVQLCKLYKKQSKNLFIDPLFLKKLYSLKPIPLPNSLIDVLVDASLAYPAYFLNDLSKEIDWISSHSQISGERWMRLYQLLMDHDYPLPSQLPPMFTEWLAHDKEKQEVVPFTISLIQKGACDLSLLQALFTHETFLELLFPTLIQTYKKTSPSKNQWRPLISFALKRCAEFKRSDLYIDELALIRELVKEKKLLAQLSEEFVYSDLNTLTCLIHQHQEMQDKEEPFSKAKHLITEISNNLPHPLPEKMHLQLYEAVSLLFALSPQIPYRYAFQELLHLIDLSRQFLIANKLTHYIQMQFWISLAKYNYMGKAQLYLNEIQQRSLAAPQAFEMIDAENLVPLWQEHPKTMIPELLLTKHPNRERFTHLSFLLKLIELVHKPSSPSIVVIEVTTGLIDMAFKSNQLQQNLPFYVQYVNHCFRIAAVDQNQQAHNALLLLLALWLNCSPPPLHNLRPNLKLLIDFLFRNISNELRLPIANTLFHFLNYQHHKLGKTSNDCFRSEIHYLTQKSKIHFPL